MWYLSRGNTNNLQIYEMAPFLNVFAFLSILAVSMQKEVASGSVGMEMQEGMRGRALHPSTFVPASRVQGGKKAWYHPKFLCMTFYV